MRSFGGMPRTRKRSEEMRCSSTRRGLLGCERSWNVLHRREDHLSTGDHVRKRTTILALCGTIGSGVLPVGAQVPVPIRTVQVIDPFALLKLTPSSAQLTAGGAGVT